MSVEARISGGIEMYDSLVKAIRDAGGSPEMVLYGKINTMTVSELFSILGSNSVRFVYNGNVRTVRYRD